MHDNFGINKCNAFELNVLQKVDAYTLKVCVAIFEYFYSQMVALSCLQFVTVSGLSKEITPFYFLFFPNLGTRHGRGNHLMISFSSQIISL